MRANQPDLFAAAGDEFSVASALPDGLTHEDGFLSASEEAALLAVLTSLPLERANYKSYTARRRVLSFGGSFDYDTNRLLPAQPLAPALEPLRDRVADWMDVPATNLVHALGAGYRPGTPLGWHRDVPDFEEIVGVSLGGEAVLRFRPHVAAGNSGTRNNHVTKKSPLRLLVVPRSIYRMRGAARWEWQHSVEATDEQRWSITFRTARKFS